MSGLLCRPLPPGSPLAYWVVGPIAESRYDVPAQPMAGEMDPFFFLTKHKNFIPHEYPCRTAFAAERRGRRPAPGARPAAETTWLPFGSPRLDLSGFWFRPTVIGTFARSFIVAERAGTATLRLRTCGGAILWVGGREMGWMADYVRNLEGSKEFHVDLERGDNEVELWFDDLAERDARFYVQLDYVDGPPARQALPAAADPDGAGRATPGADAAAADGASAGAASATSAAERAGAAAEAIEAALGSLRFVEPAYRSGTVGLALSEPLGVDAELELVVSGDFISIEEPHRIRMRWPKSARSVALADAASLPADFRRCAVRMSAGGFSAERSLGVELCRDPGPAPEALSARIVEALDEAARRGEPDTSVALARLAIGLAGPETDAMIGAFLPAIEDCHDCADFSLVPLLWCRREYRAALDPDLASRVDRAVLGFRYWMDEPGDDVQWYFSENHALLFHTAAYLAGSMYPRERFVRTGRSGTEQSVVGLARVRAWLDHFESWEMAEFNSAAYFPIDLCGLTALFALAPDADVGARAGAAVVRLLELIARSAHHGVLTAAQGRSYEHTLIAAGSLELTSIARLLWGRGSYGRRVHALPQLALCLRDRGLAVPSELGDAADYRGPGAVEWSFAQGQDRVAKLYHYKTRAFAMGSAARYRWGEWGYQETPLQLRLGEEPNAQVWINHPGEVLHFGFGRPSYWGGSGTMPRVQQYRALALLSFDCSPEQPGFTHAWFPRGFFDESAVDGAVAAARSGEGLVVLKGSSAFERAESGPGAGVELKLPGRKATWLVRLGDTANHGSLSRFSSAFGSLSARLGSDGAMLVDDPEYGLVRFCQDGRVEAEGRALEPEDWSIGGKSVEWQK